MKINKIEIDGREIIFREDTTDLNCLLEVLDKKVYQHRGFNLFVEEGEHWLDLGGNIGAFAVFAKRNGATCESYEPIKENFEILQKNIKTLGEGFSCFEHAVTNSHDEYLDMFSGNKESDRYRFTIKKRGEKYFKGSFKNKHASIFENRKFDGVKIDIETSEFGLLDDRLIPNCNKLIMEYHISKDSDFNNFDRRMNYLREIFDEVYYMESLDKFPRDKKYPGSFDRMIYCKNYAR